MHNVASNKSLQEEVTSTFVRQQQEYSHSRKCKCMNQMSYPPCWGCFARSLESVLRFGLPGSINLKIVFLGSQYHPSSAPNSPKLNSKFFFFWHRLVNMYTVTFWLNVYIYSDLHFCQTGGILPNVLALHSQLIHCPAGCQNSDENLYLQFSTDMGRYLNTSRYIRYQSGRER